MSDRAQQPEPNRPDQRFPAAVRLRKQSEFDAVYAANRYEADATLVITAFANSAATTRLGLSIGRQYGNAVVRNRWKRLIREAFRRNRFRLPCGLDLVIRPRRGAVAEYAAIERSLLELTRRLVRDRSPGQRGTGPKKPRPPGAAKS